MGSKNNVTDLQKGFNLVGDLVSMFDGSSPGTEIDYSGDYEETALMTELDARERAVAQQKAARERAGELHDKQEYDRARHNTEWGQSGLAMSGSKELVKNSRQLSDKQDEEDELLAGEMAAGDTMENGLRQANIYRIRRGLAPRRSTLSLGSTIYNNRRS